MQFALEPSDIQAISDVVIRRLTPILKEILDAAQHPAQPREALPVRTDSPVKNEIVKRSEVARMTGLSSTTLWRIEKDGEFPSRIHLTKNRVGWRRTEIETWLASRQAVQASSTRSKSLFTE